jgi:hypothetical protein
MLMISHGMALDVSDITRYGSKMLMISHGMTLDVSDIQRYGIRC